MMLRMVESERCDTGVLVLVIVLFVVIVFVVIVFVVIVFVVFVRVFVSEDGDGQDRRAFVANANVHEGVRLMIVRVLLRMFVSRGLRCMWLYLGLLFRGQDVLILVPVRPPREDLARFQTAAPTLKSSRRLLKLPALENGTPESTSAPRSMSPLMH